jgi:hypothetical protein
MPEALAVDVAETDIIWLGEGADEGTGTDLLVVKDQDGTPRVRQAAQPGDEVVSRIRVRRPPSVAGRQQLDEVVCRSVGGATYQLPTEVEEYDCVFWTESAVRKFLWPYYHAHRLWNADLQRLRDEYESDPTAVAIAHQAPSKSRILRLTSDGAIVAGPAAGGSTL